MKLAYCVVLLAVSPAWAYSNGYLPGSALSPIYHPSARVKLSNDAAAAWNTMRLKFRHEKTDVYPGGSLSAYRTYAQQVYMKRVYGSNAATPGTSNHGWGLAVDLDTHVMRSNLDRWGATYGWAKRWSDASWEWWHIKYRAGVWKKRPDPGTSSVYPILRKGSGGPMQELFVTSVQKNLVKWGYSVHATGSFDAATDSAVKKFQRDHNLGANGVVNEKTWTKLKSKPPKKPTPPTPTPTPTDVARLLAPVPTVTLAANGTTVVTIAYRNTGGVTWMPTRTDLEETNHSTSFKCPIGAVTKPTQTGTFKFNVHVPAGLGPQQIVEQLGIFDGGKLVRSSVVALKVNVR